LQTLPDQLCFLSSIHHAEKGGYMETRRHSSKPKILVVEDHEASRHHLLSVLSGLDAATRQSDTGLSALQTAIRWLPQLIFMDLNLPDCTGIEVARKIRDRWPPSHPPVKIVLLSAENLRARSEEPDLSGIDHAITKPASGSAIRQLATDLLGLSPGLPSPPATGAELRKLFTIELEQQLPRLENHLLENDRERAFFLLHQLIASAALTGEKKLETNLILLNRLVRQTAGTADLARAYYGIFQAAQAFMRKAGTTASG
jgi:CheY-like chemotaxis protein